MTINIEKEKMRLTEKELEIFNLFKDNKGITFRKIGSILNKSVGTVHNIVQKLIDKKYLAKDGYEIFPIRNLESDFLYIPYYGEVQAGTSNRLVEDKPIKNIPVSKDLIFRHSKNLFLVKATGDSMEPEIKEGAILLCEFNNKDTKSLNNKVLIVVTELDGVKVKKLDLNKKAFVSFNKSFPDIEFTIEDRIIGEVKQIISQQL